MVVLRIAAKLHGGGPCPCAFALLVDNRLRRRYMGSVLDRIGIRSGERMLELGPGPGAFTVEAAWRTKPGGSVAAVDITPRMIAALLVPVLPEIPDRQRALGELYRVLRPGGVLFITEEFLDPDYPLARTTIRWAEEAGFELAERHGNWWVYTLNFRKRA